MHNIITFSVGVIVCLYGLMFLAFGIAIFRQVSPTKPTRYTGLSPSQNVYLRTEVLPLNPSLYSPLGGTNCVHWDIRVWSSNSTARGSSSSIIHHESAGREFFISGEGGPIRVRLSLRCSPPISVEAVELSQDFVTYSDQQHLGKSFSCSTSEEYVHQRKISTTQTGIIPKSLTLEEKCICPGQILHIWGNMGGNREVTPTLEATMISAKGASYHWLQGSIAIMAGMFLLYVGLGLVMVGLQGP